MNRGEVWWLEHPEAGRRPACIHTRQAAIPALRSVLVVPATRTVRGIPTEVPLGRADGMPEDCALSFDNLTNRDYYETQNYFESRVTPDAPIVARIHGTPGYPLAAVVGLTFRLGEASSRLRR